MGGPLQRSWAPIGPGHALGCWGLMPPARRSSRQHKPGPLCLCDLLSHAVGLVSFLGFWVGWVGRGQEAGLALGSLQIAFLGSWVGWVGRGQEAGLVLGSLHPFWPGRMGGPRPRAGLPSCFLSGVLGRMGVPQPRG